MKVRSPTLLHAQEKVEVEIEEGHMKEKGLETERTEIETEIGIEIETDIEIEEAGLMVSIVVGTMRGNLHVMTEIASTIVEGNTEKEVEEVMMSEKEVTVIVIVEVIDPETGMIEMIETGETPGIEIETGKEIWIGNWREEGAVL